MPASPLNTGWPTGATDGTGDRRRCRIAAISTLLVLLTLLGQTHGPVAAQSVQGFSEYQVKAAFLLNFAKFVTWPSAAFGEPGAPFILCVAGDDPFGPILDETIRGETVGGRDVIIRRTTHGALHDCHTVFISVSETERLDELLAPLDDHSVLTIAESDQFARRGGIITLRMEQKRVRFSINLEAAERAGLRVSSTLLELATIVRGG